MPLGHAVISQFQPVQYMLGVVQRGELRVRVLQDVELLAYLRRQRLEQFLVVLSAKTS